MTIGTDDFVMPTTEGGGFAGLEASATELLDKVNTIPFDADRRQPRRQTCDGLNDVANGPQLKQALTDRSTQRIGVVQDHGAEPR